MFFVIFTDYRKLSWLLQIANKLAAMRWVTELWDTWSRLTPPRRYATRRKALPARSCAPAGLFPELAPWPARWNLIPADASPTVHRQDKGQVGPIRVSGGASPSQLETLIRRTRGESSASFFLKPSSRVIRRGSVCVYGTLNSDINLSVRFMFSIII